MNFQLNSAVHRDIREAMEFYCESAGGEIALDFYEFRNHAELAAKSPSPYRVYLDDDTKIRRVNFHRFPYHFLYRQIDVQTIRILVRHDHRHPSYGLDRW